jgi:hypothetical protein
VLKEEKQKFDEDPLCLRGCKGVSETRQQPKNSRLSLETKKNINSMSKQAKFLFQLIRRAQGSRANPGQRKIFKPSFEMKFSLPTPGGGTGMTLFSKLIRTKDLRKLQGDDPKSTKPKLTVNLICSELRRIPKGTRRVSLCDSSDGNVIRKVP